MKIDPAPADPDSIEAFAAQVREHQAGLRAFIRALGVEPDWVDDLAQEVLLIAFRKQAQFDSTKDFGRWLRGIARHHVANERRKEARRSRLLNGALTEVLLELDASVAADSTDTRLVLDALRDCVEQLPEPGRALLRRRYATNENTSVLGNALEQSAVAIRPSLLRLRLAVKRWSMASSGRRGDDRRALRRIARPVARRRTLVRRGGGSFRGGACRSPAQAGRDATSRVVGTVLAAEADAVAFVAETARQLTGVASEEAAGAAGRRNALSWVWSPAFRRFGRTTGGADLVNAELRTWGWRLALALAACLVLFFSLGVRFFGPTMGEPVVAAVAGGVTLERMSQPSPAAAGTRLQPGDVLLTDTNATAVISFGAERTRFDLAAETALTLTSLAGGKRFDLHSGRLEAEVARQRPFAPLVVTTPQAEARVLGTTFLLLAAVDATRLTVTLCRAHRCRRGNRSSPSYSTPTAINSRAPITHDESRIWLALDSL